MRPMRFFIISVPDIRFSSVGKVVIATSNKRQCFVVSRGFVLLTGVASLVFARATPKARVVNLVIAKNHVLFCHGVSYPRYGL